MFRCCNRAEGDRWIRAAVFAIVLIPIIPPADAQILFRIGSGGSGGTYFPIANLIATSLSGQSGCAVEQECGESGLLAVAQLSNGSVANVRDLGNRRLEAGLVQADIAYEAYLGDGDFVHDGPYDGLRAIANLYPETVHLVVTAESPIRTVRQLAGHKVSLDEPGSGSLLGARLVLDAYNVEEGDLSTVFVKPQLAAAEMQAGRLDAFLVIAGYPAAAVAKLAEAHPIRLIPIDGPRAAVLRKAKPYFSAAEIPDGIYRGVPAARTLAVGAQLLVDAQLDDALVYRVTRALWSEATRQALRHGHPQGRQVELANALKGIAIPLHSGAERYYREVGMIGEERGEP